MQYLVDTYDTKHILSSTDPKERAQITQYLFFQVRTSLSFPRFVA